MAGKKRNGTQKFATVALLIAYSEISNIDGDKVYCADIRRELTWTPGSAAANNGVTVVSQTSEVANGRWLADIASNASLTGTVAVLSLDNNQEGTFTGTIAGLPVGTNISAVATNLATCYGGAALPDGIEIEFMDGIKTADTVECKVVNNTATDDTTAFVLNVQVTLL